MKKVLRINKDGFYIEDVIISSTDKIPSDCIEVHCPEGFYAPKWNGETWTEGLSDEEIKLQKSQNDSKDKIELLEDEVLSLKLALEKVLEEKDSTKQNLEEKDSSKQIMTTSGVLSASDVKEKENITRLNGREAVYSEELNRMVEFAPRMDIQHSRAVNNDYYEFIKNKFKPTYYNYKLTNVERSLDANSHTTESEERLLSNVGFIAQDYDLENDKVAKEFILKDDDGNLMYNHMSYVTVGLVALQEAIKEIEKLKEEIEKLKN